VSLRRCNNFLDNINDCKLIDLGAIGTKFTWRGAQVSGHDRIFERLDRALSNDEWRIMFPEAIVKVLPRIDFSDHHPILIMLQGIHHTQRKNKFRFEKAWMYHDTYKDLVKHQWNKNDALPHNISHMEVELNKWKRNVFGSIHKRKTDLMNRINGIQRRQQVEKNNKFLERLERNLQQELNLILKQEEAMWFQKSRSQWIKDGDRNTRYYHVKTITRRRRNKILMLRNEQNEWIDDEARLQEMVNSYYQKLFTASNNTIHWQQTKYSYPSISDSDHDDLKDIIRNGEVRNALFDMSPWKEPGPTVFQQVSTNVDGVKWKIVFVTLSDQYGSTRLMWLLLITRISALYQR
jgi:hypothetical protein